MQVVQLGHLSRLLDLPPRSAVARSASVRPGVVTGMSSNTTLSTGRRVRWTTTCPLLRTPLVWAAVTSIFGVAVGRMPHKSAALR
jgi:hypothetical protein